MKGPVRTYQQCASKTHEAQHLHTNYHDIVGNMHDFHGFRQKLFRHDGREMVC